MAGKVSFYLNGEAITIDDPSPDLLLIDYLRSPEVGLAGPKKGCGQGGCGACTVILSSWNGNQAEHRAINSCLRPVCSLGGLAVTTVEGTGAAERPAPNYPHYANTYGRAAAPLDLPMPLQDAACKQAVSSRRQSREVELPKSECERCEGMNPVSHRLALNNGTQCGYCTVGFVMNMTEFLANNPRATKKEIEDIFDGNICRCTGYRPILTGMKTFATDWSREDEEHRMKCLSDDGCQAQRTAASVWIPFPEGAKSGPQPAEMTVGRQIWLTPTRLEQLCEFMCIYPDRVVRLVHGNTSYGIYEEEYHAAEVLVDIRLVQELYGCYVESDTLVVGAAVTYSDLIEFLRGEMTPGVDFEPTRIGAVQFMSQRTAGRIVRNAATLGGNTMLVLTHILEGEPFPSDALTALDAIDARIEFMRASTCEKFWLTVNELVDAVLQDPSLAKDIVLLRYHLPYGSLDEIVLPQKVALRQVNSHSIVNTTSRLTVDKNLGVTDVALVFGGIAPFPWRPRETEARIRERQLSLEDFAELAETLEREVDAELDRWAERMQGLPSEGLTNEYRKQLAVSFLYKTVVHALLQRNQPVPQRVQSSADVKWGRWQVSDGRQSYENQAFKAPVSQPYIKLMAMYQASGQVHYTHELQVPPLTVNAAFVQSRRALADYFYIRPGTDERIDAEELRTLLSEQFDSFVDLVTHEQIPPHGMNLQGMGSDQPLFAVDRVSYVGQAISLVIAESETTADKIAEYVSLHCVGYGAVDWPEPWKEPILSIDDAIRVGSIYPDCPKHAAFVSHIWRITRPGSKLDWASQKDPLDKEIVRREAVVDHVPCIVIEGTQTTGGQAHFYMETQSCVAKPIDAERMLVHPSSQSPMEMHNTVKAALGVEYNQIDVEIHQLGGGYGGKTEQARFVAGPTAVAARHCGRPVRLVMPRDEDTSMIGKRHPYYGQYQIAIDEEGIIRGLDNKMWGDGGAFYDCSFIVSNCIQTRADGAYHVRNFQNQIDVCRTNKAPNTAMRAFGDIQCKLILENALEDAAFAVGKTPEEVREKNLYQRGDVTPFGQALSYCYMREVWNYLKEVACFERKLREVNEFNASNKWRKRGISMVPVKYGSGYNLVQLEQAVAVITVFSGDGSVIVHQGGVDMGQGMMTKCEQVASYILNVPMELIHTEGPRTSVTPNPTSTGGSTGTAYNGEAVKQACEDLRSRLMAFGYEMLKDKGDHWCHEQGIDFWNFGEKGWAAETDKPQGPHKKLVWQNLVQLAYTKRVSLVSTFTAQIAGGTTPMPNVTYKPKDEQPHLQGVEVADQFIAGAVDSFVGFTFSAACSVVELDVLTGEVKVLSADVCYDMGWSLNPALDIGQVEGAFVQGIGYVLTEHLVFQPDGDEKGRLNTVNTWRYKPPAVTTIPLEMNVHLFPRHLADSVPENPDGLLSAKEVGEPPLVLANTVFFALKRAIRASREERGLPGLFRLDAPATVQEVRRACEIDIHELGNEQA